MASFRRRAGTYVLAGALVAAGAACSGSSGDGADGSGAGGGAGTAGAGGTGGSSGTGGGGAGPSGSPMPTQTGNPAVDRLGAAAAQCGYQSPSTVPVGWDTAGWGQGCSIWAPGGWGFQGSGTQMIFATDPVQPYGAVVGAGVPTSGTEPTACTARGVADYFLALYEGLGCTSPKIEYYADGELLIVDTSYPLGHSVFTCTYQGQPMVGYQLTMGLSDGMCNVVLSAFWEPVSDIEAMTCTLSQVLNSVTCPTGGSNECVDVDCDTACRSTGKTGGQCPTSGGEGCECW